jgi:hypothetical protein
METLVAAEDGKRGKAGGDGISQGRVRRGAPLVRLTARTTGEAVVEAVRHKVTGTGGRSFMLARPSVMRSCSDAPRAL